MDLQIKINLDNAAFNPCAGAETARILRELAHRLEGSDMDFGQGKLYDSNGNQIGGFEVVSD